MAEIKEDPIRVHLIGPYSLTRAGLCQIIETQADIKVVAQTGNINEALTLAAETKPDIILFEYKPEVGLDLEAPKALINCCKNARIILVTEINDCEFHVKAVKSGVLGIILKTQPAETLIKAIRKVHQGEAWLERSLVANMVNSSSFVNSDVKADPKAEIEKILTNREMDLIPLIGRGLNNKQIAKELCIAESTVRHHLSSIYSKLGVANRFELLLYSQQNDLI